MTIDKFDPQPGRVETFLSNPGPFQKESLYICNPADDIDWHALEGLDVYDLLRALLADQIKRGYCEVFSPMELDISMTTAPIIMLEVEKNAAGDLITYYRSAYNLPNYKQLDIIDELRNGNEIKFYRTGKA